LVLEKSSGMDEQGWMISEAARGLAALLVNEF